MNTQSERVQLGKSDVWVSPLGIGTWQWGDRLFWNYGAAYGSADLKPAFDAALNAGINWFDTAELYGPHTSERLLGQFMRESHAQPLIATKFFPIPWRFWRGSLLRALRNSLKRLQLKQVDLHQIHWPSPTMSVETQAAALADAVDAGLTRAVGVSNFDVAQMRRAHAVLARRGIPLATNQVEYSLIQRAPERTGLVAACQELGVTLIAYSPIGKGILSGKYSAQHPPPGPRAGRYPAARLARMQPLLDLLKDLGRAHDRTPSQVALNWLICKGTLPIPGVKNARQVQDNAGALGWRLRDNDVRALDDASESL